MRVAVNAEQLLYRSPGGIGRYTADLLTVLPDRFPDCELTPFTARHRPGQVRAALAGAGVAAPVVDRTQIQRLPRPALYESWLRLGRPGLRVRPDPDLVHAPSVAVPPVPRRVPLVVTIHDVAPELYPESFPRHGRSFHALGLAAAARRADAVIAGSQAAADEISAHSPIGADRITVVHYGVARHEVDAAWRDETLDRFGLADRPYVFWVGSMEPRKGVGALVAAMAEIRRRGAHPDVATVLAGFEGWLQTGLVDPQDVARLGDSLRRVGRLDEADLWALYAGAAVVAVPSRHEGFGLPAVEAMSQGAAVVASDIPSLREVTDGAAVLVNPGDHRAWADAIEELLSDEARRRDIAKKGRRRSEAFGLDRMAAGTWAVYQQVSR